MPFGKNVTPERPVPKPAEAPKPPVEFKPKGMFGSPGGYKDWGSMREFARHAPFEPLPGTSQRLGKDERVKLVDELRQRAGEAGIHGLSESTFRDRILPNLKKELYRLNEAGKVTEKKQLERKMQQWEKWIRGQ